MVEISPRNSKHCNKVSHCFRTVECFKCRANVISVLSAQWCPRGTTFLRKHVRRFNGPLAAAYPKLTWESAAVWVADRALCIPVSSVFWIVLTQSARRTLGDGWCCRYSILKSMRCTRSTWHPSGLLRQEIFLHQEVLSDHVVMDVMIQKKRRFRLLICLNYITC